MNRKEGKVKAEARFQDDFKNAVRRGVIMQLYKEDYLSEAQYAQLLKRPLREEAANHII